MILCGLYARLIYLSRAPLSRIAESAECTELLRNAKAPSREIYRVLHDRELTGLRSAYPQAPSAVQALVGRREHRHEVKGGSMRLWSAALPGGTICRVEEGPGAGLHVVSPELYLFLRAAELSRWELVLLAMEFWGRFDSRDDRESGVEARPYPLASQNSVERVMLAIEGRVPGIALMRFALARGLPGSRSPRESALALFLSLPRKLGGLGLDPPELNTSVGLSARGKQIFGAPQAMPDLLFPASSIDVEYDSSAHHLGADEVLHDKLRQLALEASGITVMPITGPVVREYGQLVAAADAIAAAVNGRDPSPLSERLEERRRELYRQLFRLRSLW